MSEDERQYKYRFINANIPLFSALRAVKAGDVKGKLALRRNIEDGYSSSDPKIGIFKPMHESLKKRRSHKKYTYANHYGEFIGYKIAESIGIPACKVELAKRDYRNQYSGKVSEVEGCISYVDLEDDEELVNGMTIVEMYRRDVLSKSKPRQDYSYSNNNIDVIIEATKYFLDQKTSLTNAEKQKICDDIIQMVVFDCAFGNPDRNDENWSLKVRSFYKDKRGLSDKVELYPMYDNEKILGLMERLDLVEKMTEKSDSEIEMFSDIALNSRMGFGEENQNVPYTKILKHLLSKYPSPTKKAIDKVLKLKERDLEELLDETEGLKEPYKVLAKKIHQIRVKNIVKVLDEYYTEKNKSGIEI